MVNGLSVVIPSKNLSNITQCVSAVNENEPNANVIVVDDGIQWGVGGLPLKGRRIDGQKPFIFSRNVNAGFAAAGTDDVIVLNDDALLKTPGGFSLLQREAEAHKDFGIIGSTVSRGHVGNRNQWPLNIGLRADSRMVCFVCVLIPRRTIDFVGLMDERFTAYGFEDDDYCLRVRRSGLKIGIHDGCYVDHGSLKSTFRGDPKRPGPLKDGLEIFINKWGAHPL